MKQCTICAFEIKLGEDFMYEGRQDNKDAWAHQECVNDQNEQSRGSIERAMKRLSEDWSNPEEDHYRDILERANMLY